jgi:hypothetical protein
MALLGQPGTTLRLAPRSMSPVQLDTSQATPELFIRLGKHVPPYALNTCDVFLPQETFAYALNTFPMAMGAQNTRRFLMEVICPSREMP